LFREIFIAAGRGVVIPNAPDMARAQGE